MSEKAAKKPKRTTKTEPAEQPQPPTPTPAQPPQPQEPSMRQMLDLMAKQQEETRKQMNTLAEAIVKINEKVEAKGASSSGGGDVEAFTKIANMFAPKSTSLDDFARMAEGFARAADAIEHFRRPSRIGAGEAYLMRLGVRAGYPRYMTKAELARMESAIGITEAFEGEGESEHVSE